MEFDRRAHGTAASIVDPGIQGRWEWMTAGAATRCAADAAGPISYSLCGDIGVRRAQLDAGALGFDNYVRQLDAVLRRAGVETRGAVRRVVRRLHRACATPRRDPNGSRAGPRVGAGARLGAVDRQQRVPGAAAG